MTGTRPYEVDDVPMWDLANATPPAIQRDNTVYEKGTNPMTALYKHLGELGFRRAFEREQEAIRQSDTDALRLMADPRILDV